jgi:hypothetical protein
MSIKLSISSGMLHSFSYSMLGNIRCSQHTLRSDPCYFKGIFYPKSNDVPAKDYSKRIDLSRTD